MENLSRENRFQIKNPSANIQLYSAATPNGWKVACVLEEIHELRIEKEDFEYEAHTVDIRHHESREQPYLSMCPNGKIPCIGMRHIQLPFLFYQTILFIDYFHTHHRAVEPCSNQTIWESGAILMYLGEKYHELLPQKGSLRYDVLKWTFWGSAEVSPKFKLFAYFYQYCTHDLPYVTHKVISMF